MRRMHVNPFDDKKTENEFRHRISGFNLEMSENMIFHCRRMGQQSPSPRDAKFCLIEWHMRACHTMNSHLTLCFLLFEFCMANTTINFIYPIFLLQADDEVPIWICGEPRFISGVTSATTCNELIQALIDDELNNVGNGKLHRIE